MPTRLQDIELSDVSERDRRLARLRRSRELQARFQALDRSEPHDLEIECLQTIRRTLSRGLELAAEIQLEAVPGSCRGASMLNTRIFRKCPPAKVLNASVEQHVAAVGDTKVAGAQVERLCHAGE